MKTSIHRHLLLWLMGALGVGASLLIGGSYWVLRNEMGEVFEDNLKQVALAVANHHGNHGGAAPPARLARTARRACCCPPPKARCSCKAAARCWAPAARRACASTARPAPLPAPRPRWPIC